MGVGEDPGAKAQRDYRSRTDDPLGVAMSDTTFVFVTAREWREKEAWAPVDADPAASRAGNQPTPSRLISQSLITALGASRDLGRRHA